MLRSLTLPRVAEKVIDRAEKIELLVDKAEELNEQAARFKKQSNTVRRPPRARTHTRAHARTRAVPSATAAQGCAALTD